MSSNTSFRDVLMWIYEEYGQAIRRMPIPQGRTQDWRVI